MISPVFMINVVDQTPRFVGAEKKAERLILEPPAPPLSISKRKTRLLRQIVADLGRISSSADASNGSVTIWFQQRPFLDHLEQVPECHRTGLLAVINGVVEEYVPAPELRAYLFAGPYRLQLNQRAILIIDSLVAEYVHEITGVWSGPTPIKLLRKRLGMHSWGPALTVKLQAGRK